MKFHKLLSLALLACLLCAACAQGNAPPQPTSQASPDAGSPPTGSATPGPTSAPTGRVPLQVFCAGSLLLPFNELEKVFESARPDVDVLMECHGSIQVIRHVTELHELIDVVATADHALIPMLMYTSDDPDSGQPYASWYLRFAGNRLALAYPASARYADEIDAENWYKIITRQDVRLGLADPRFDASGYRALMALKLAERLYDQHGILRGAVDGQFRYPVTVFDEEGYSEITVPEILEPLPDARITLRGGSIQLLALLESGDVDYAFEYESVIQQHGLQMLTLPDEINLGRSELYETYSQVEVKLDFQRFASVKPVFRGEPIGYGITIPSNAPQPELAAEFIAFLLGPQGRAVMEAYYHPLSDPLECDGQSLMPSTLSALCQAGIAP
ncbi:MAG: tungstate ABC transporter substrate-binding protein WtpA [Anaerolineales bacterium]|nr:tungstate ABC transporter substrate-binding protein WtpA [Anaerolineales bacterium]